MDRNTYIDNVYAKITDAFVKNISNGKALEIRTAYVAYLQTTYNPLFENVGESDLGNVASLCAKKEKLIHLDLDEEAKFAFLFPDEKFLALQNLSLEIAHLAKEKKLDEHYQLEKTKDEYISELNFLSASISQIFRFSADRVLSEALMDLNYLFDGKEGQSFRTNIY